MIVSRPLAVHSRSDVLICNVVDSVIDVQCLAKEWEELFLCVPNASMCTHPEWTLAWYGSFGQSAIATGRETRLHIVTMRTADGGLAAVIPLYEDKPRAFWHLRRLRSIGYLGRERAYDMTEEPTMLVCPGFDDLVYRSLGGHLKTELEKGRWDFISLIGPGGLRLDSMEPLSIARQDQRSGSDYVELPETWSEYRRQLSKSMRENLPYYPRLLNRDGHQWYIRTIDDPDEIPAAVERLAVLHQLRAASTRGKAHSNHLHTHVQTDFLSNFLASTGGFISELIVDGQVVASQAFYGAGDTLTVSYSGFDEAFYKYSPIFVINATVFQNALENGTRRLNLLRNLAPWKTRWLAKTGEPMSRTYLLRRTPISIARYVLHMVKVGIERDVVLRTPVLWDRIIRRLRPKRAKVPPSHTVPSGPRRSI